MCLECNVTVPYDCLYDGVFRLTQNHLFSRELLDMWLWDVCGSGGTFRDAYASWSSKSYATTASFHRLGTDNYATRQLSNEAFTSYLKLLAFASETELHELFYCTECETTDENGDKSLSEVVIDGTALGILETLPQFERNTEVVTAVPLVPDKQHLMPELKLRSFIDSVLVTSKLADENGNFNVSLRLSVWRNRQSLID